MFFRKNLLPLKTKSGKELRLYSKLFLPLILSVFILLNTIVFAENIESTENYLQAVETNKNSRYIDYSKLYAGDDKYEKFNRKMFNLNKNLNKYIARPVHVLWSSIMPKYGIDRIRDAYNNIEYPKRLASCILQKDGQGVKTETVRFLTNSTIGLGGLFDPADKIFKIKPTNENMEQALSKCKVKQGNYLVMPCLNSCTPRSLCGRALEAALDPAIYLATPITSLIKFGLMVNRTSYMQPIVQMIESTYADPYDIQKKLFGLENYIKGENYNRMNLLETTKESDIVDENGIITGMASEIVPETEGEKAFKNDILPLGEDVYEKIIPDIKLEGYQVQSPIVDSMKTALFEKPEMNKSIWNDISIWNRSFDKKIKTDDVVITEGRLPYKFKYILQKDKTAPLAIIYPSVGEGAGAHHSKVFAKILYDEGYSVLMQGNHFQWEFVNSMPEGYCPGLPEKDVEKIKLVTSKIVEKLTDKEGCEFKDKIIIGTSFGAMASLYVADSESKENTLNVSKFIAISPPIDLKFALKQIDKNSEEFDTNSDDIKEKISITAAKILQLYDIKNNSKDFKYEKFPFSEEEGKLITTFILRQKLSDLIYTIENVSSKDKSDIYEYINNMSYRDYVEKYILNGQNFDELGYQASLYSLADYLQNNDNYKIYHSLDDYFINNKQLIKLKTLAGKNLVCLDCGSHLGFLYRPEFEKAFISDIKFEFDK